MHLGMDLPDALRRVTSVPASVIKRSQDLGTLQVGAVGDAVLFRLRQGHRPLADTTGRVEDLTHWIDPVSVIKSGQIVARHSAREE